MSKRSKRKQLFGAKVLAIIAAAVFMVEGVHDLYADKPSGVGVKKETYKEGTVEKNVMVKPEETVEIESSERDTLGECQETINGILCNQKDEYMLAKIAMAEAEGEGVKGKALVILVVLNRVRSDGFPDSISEVIFEQGQFSPVSSGRYDRVEPDQECYEALELIRSKNWDESQSALYFESESASNWHKNNLHFLFQYGRHYFYTDKELAE